MAQKEYGVMPDKPAQTATVKGDTGTYEVWGLDWYHGRALIFRSGELEWVDIKKVKFND